MKHDVVFFKKKIFCATMLFIFVITGFTGFSQPYINGKEVIEEESVLTTFETLPDSAYIVYDLEKGQTLFSKDVKLSVNASMLSRMMTCLIALENHSLTDKITASYSSVSADGNFTIKEGRTYTIDSLVNTTLIGNADNAAKLLSENTEIHTVNDSNNSFVSYMNEKAIKFGMNDTFFTSAYGAANELQKTTVNDTVQFLKQALLNTSFKKIYCSPVAVSWDGIIMNNPNDIVIQNTTATLGGTASYYDLNSEKISATYYMDNNEKNIIDQRKILMVVHGADTDSLNDIQNQLLNKYYTEWVRILYKGKGDIVSILSVGDQKLKLITTSDICFYAPANEEDYIENISFSYSQGFAPDIITPPVYKDTPICAVRYQLKDKTSFDVVLYSENTIISERTSVNKMVNLMSDYPEIFLTIFVLCVITMLFCIRKIYWHFNLKT